MTSYKRAILTGWIILTICYLASLFGYLAYGFPTSNHNPMRQHVVHASQKMQTLFSANALDNTNWQSHFRGNHNVHISLLTLPISEVEPPTALVKTTQRPNGSVMCSNNSLNCYFKLSQHEILQLTPVFNSQTSFVFTIHILVISMLFIVSAVALYLFIDKKERSTLQNTLTARGIAFDQSTNEPLYEQLINFIEQNKRDVTNKSAIKKHLLNGIAHELRSPLSRIQFALDMLPKTHDPAHKKLYRQIDTEVQALNSMASELLRYARLEYMEKPLCFSQVSLDELIKESLTRVCASYPKVHFIYDSCACLLNCDRTLLIKALENVLQNAGRAAHHVVEISCWFSQSYCNISIEDDGSGIAKDDVVRIFEPFARLNQSRQRESGGVGLGLAVTKSIIGRHHGYITVDESKLNGARFILALPANNAQC